MKRVFGSGQDPFPPSLGTGALLYLSLSRWLLDFCRTTRPRVLSRSPASTSIPLEGNGQVGQWSEGLMEIYARPDSGGRTMASEALLIDGLPPSPRLRDSPRIRTKGDLLTKNARPAARATPGQNYSPRVGGDREVARTCGNAQPQSKPRTVHCTV